MVVSRGVQALDHLCTLLTVVAGDEGHLSVASVVLIPALDIFLVHGRPDVSPFELLPTHIVFSTHEGTMYNKCDVVEEIPRLELERTVRVSEAVLKVEACMVGGLQCDDTLRFVRDFFVLLDL